MSVAGSAKALLTKDKHVAEIIPKPIPKLF